MTESTDHTKEIILIMKEQNNRIKYYEINISGISVASNIVFVGTDDYIENIMVVY